MATTRTRLTVSYAVVLMGTLVVFAIALYSARRSRAKDELAAEAFRFADDIRTSIRRAQAEKTQLTVVDTLNFPNAHATPELTALLDSIPGYFLLFNYQEKLLYASAQMRTVPSDDRRFVDSTALQLTPDQIGAIASIRGDSTHLFLVARRDIAPASNIARIVAGLPASTAELSPQLLLGTIIAIVPLVLLASISVAYLVAGREFGRVDQLINEVEAITDGRSLHRRLPADSSDDELSRLGTTVNAMLTRLEDSFGALRRFTADASHELKTPLTVLRADVERATHPATSRGERMVALEEALQETARMADLVDSLLTLARADEGRFDLYRVPVELEPLVREVYETAVILGEDAGLSLDLPTLENAVVMGDRTRLRQLLLNLITNAIKYTPRGGRVELSVTRRAVDEIAIAVRDTGIGIAAAELAHVFERFWRADRARSRASERGGFGLGLSISQWIAQAHGGTLTVHSRLGRGSVFTVVLPSVPVPPPRVAAGSEEERVLAAEKAESNIDFTQT